MSIRVAKFQNALGQEFFSLMETSNEKSYTLHTSDCLIGVMRDFEGRVDDERER